MEVKKEKKTFNVYKKYYSIDKNTQLMGNLREKEKEK